MGSILGWGTKILHAVWHDQGKKKKNENKGYKTLKRVSTIFVTFLQAQGEQKWDGELDSAAKGEDGTSETTEIC